MLAILCGAEVLEIYADDSNEDDDEAGFGPDSQLPEDGFAYLRRVRKEAARYPKMYRVSSRENASRMINC